MNSQESGIISAIGSIFGLLLKTRYVWSSNHILISVPIVIIVRVQNIFFNYRVLTFISLSDFIYDQQVLEQTYITSSSLTFVKRMSDLERV